MPLAIGGVAAHDDSMHSGSAKRGAASGVASLDAATKVPAAQIPNLSGTYAALSDGVAANIKAGSYAGNGTQNRAIPHGLGKIPKWVFLIDETIPYIVFLQDHILFGGNSTATVNHGVTAMDATNFYVGDVSFIININGTTYKWIAIG